MLSTQELEKVKSVSIGSLHWSRQLSQAEKKEVVLSIVRHRDSSPEVMRVLAARLGESVGRVAKWKEGALTETGMMKKKVRRLHEEIARGATIREAARLVGMSPSAAHRRLKAVI